jgi:acyl carrier protein
MSNRIEKTFAEVLGIPVEQINDATSPDNTSEWDSLQAMNLVAALEEEFGIALSTKEIISMRTVGLVRKTLRAKGIGDV